jgi:hypothetical protein
LVFLDVGRLRCSDRHLVRFDLDGITGFWLGLWVDKSLLGKRKPLALGLGLLRNILRAQWSLSSP